MTTAHFRIKSWVLKRVQFQLCIDLRMKTELILVTVLVSCCCSAMQHTNFIVVGGTGDLARKYLWDSALELFVHNFNENTTFSFYAAARVPQNAGDETLQNILEDVQCDTDDEVCHKLRTTFIANLKYVQLKTIEQYQELCQNFSNSHDKDKQPWEMKTIFYLSVPSSAYESVAESIHDNCHQGDDVDFKVVLEKPFGSNKETAIHQTQLIGKYFKDSEIYRVDHYLAKSVVKQILNFRYTNKDVLERLMNKQLVDRVEIVMKETIGVKGRIDFYDQTGVVRDVMQNHLTELLALVAMEIPTKGINSHHIEESKLQLLRSVKPVSQNLLLMGQYVDYLEEAKLEKENISKSHFTPTFGAAMLYIDNSRWKGVPFILVSGKHMDERSSYIRIIFRERDFCVAGCATGNSSQTIYPRQLVFQIGHGAVPTPGILVSRSLFEPKWPTGLQELSITSRDSLIHGQNPGDFHYAVPLKESPAYHTVLRDLYNSIKETFVTAERLKVLWDIWNNVITKTQSILPRLYDRSIATNLNFQTQNEKLTFIHGHSEVVNIQSTDDVSSHKSIVIPKFYRNCVLICQRTNELIDSLSEHILEIAGHSIRDRGVFHIAFSGGNTPIPLFINLALNYPKFPWQNTHIWQVDERCISQKNTGSNFLSIHENLLKSIKIDYFSIHPMPVSHVGTICDPHFKGDELYEQMIKHNIPAQRFDLILLGVGVDGHTASLFPKSPLLDNAQSLVGYTKTKESALDRMSLLLPVLNNARDIAVLVTGKEKHDILKTVAEIQSKDKTFPITYISPKDGNMTWFVDFDAWIGQT